MDRQSEWIVLRRVLAFLKSRNLRAAARALEKEARLKFDVRHLHTLFERGRWRRADEYVSAFMAGAERTPEAAGTLFPIRLQRLVRALKRGDSVWAHRYRLRRLLPILLHHPDGAAARAEVDRAMRLAADEDRLRQAYPYDVDYRRRCFVDFLRYADANKYLDRCYHDPLDLHLKFMCRTSSLGLRRYSPRRRRHTTPSAAS